MAKKQLKRWVYSPPKPPKPAVPDDIKADVEAKAKELIDTVLKPEHVKPPPKAPQWNYLTDITSKSLFNNWGLTQPCQGKCRMSAHCHTPLLNRLLAVRVCPRSSTTCGGHAIWSSGSWASSRAGRCPERRW
jgi:hypothetical protein